jgi:hypothetical protein
MSRDTTDPTVRAMMRDHARAMLPGGNVDGRYSDAEVDAMLDEPLEPDLVEWMEPEDSESTLEGWLRHPLLIAAWASHWPGVANRIVEWKREQVATALKRGQWHKAVWLHERAHRCNALVHVEHLAGKRMTNLEYWTLVEAVWIDSENIGQNRDQWDALWTSKRTRREMVMTPEEREALAAMPDPIPVYRGCIAERNPDGLSWTLDFDRARWFAQRFEWHGTPTVLAGDVAKADVLAYFTGRNEQEIVSQSVRITARRAVPKKEASP